MISFYNQNVEKPKINFQSVKKWIKTIIENFGYKTGNISIIFCSDNFILEYNIKFLNHNYFTDIITFNYNESNKISGDLFISIETVKKNADIYNVTENQEILRVIIHGVLHLLGFNDQQDEDILEMRKQESAALEQYTFS